MGLGGAATEGRPWAALRAGTTPYIASGLVVYSLSSRCLRYLEFGHLEQEPIMGTGPNDSTWKHSGDRTGKDDTGGQWESSLER